MADDEVTTVPLASPTGLPTDTGVELVIDRVDSSGTATPTLEETVVGVISGNNLTSVVRGIEGTAQAHSAGAVVECILTADNWNDVIDGIMVEHAQDGGHDLAGGISVVEINDTSGNEEIKFTATGSAVNEFTIANAQTACEPTLSVTGGDTNIGLKLAPKGTGKVQITANDLNLGAEAANIQVAAADPWRTISLPAKSWSPTTTAGCGGPTKVEAGTNDIDYEVLEFDTSTDEQAFINFPMPASYDGGVVQFRVFWTNAAGESDDTIEVELSGRSFGNDEAIDQANGTAVAVTDTWIAQGDVHITDWSTDTTLAGTPAGNELVHLEIMRDVSGDDLAGDLRVIAVQLRYKTAQYSD